MITNNQFDNFKKDFDKLVELYKEKYSVDKKRNWQEYGNGAKVDCTKAFIGRRAYVVIVKN